VAGDGQALAGSNVERHSGPAPAVDVKSQGRESLDGRIGWQRLMVSRYPIDGRAPDRLAQAGEWSRGPCTFSLRIASGRVAGRRFHRQQAHHLEEMVLDNVANRPGLVVEKAPRSATSIASGMLICTLPHGRDPERLQERVGEAEVDQVLDRLLAQVVVDPEDVGFGEDFVDRSR